MHCNGNIILEKPLDFMYCVASRFGYPNCRLSELSIIRTVDYPNCRLSELSIIRTVDYPNYRRSQLVLTIAAVLYIILCVPSCAIVVMHDEADASTARDGDNDDGDSFTAAFTLP